MTRKLSSLTRLDQGELPLWALPVLGAAAAVLHRGVDMPLNLPGHHGLELLTALLFARIASTRPWAACAAITGTIGTDLVLASDMLHSLRHVPTYTLTAALVDLAWRTFGTRCRALWAAALIGAAAHAAKPAFFTLVAMMSGLSFGFMRHGPIFPFITHLAFGAVGAICGAVLARGWMNLPGGR